MDRCKSKQETINVHRADAYVDRESHWRKASFTGTVEDMRQQFAGLGTALAQQYPAPPAEVKTQDAAVDDLEVRVYTTTTSNTDVLLPVGIYAHGGGFVLVTLKARIIFVVSSPIRQRVFL
jgi:acetyl esterase/lipase